MTAIITTVYPLAGGNGANYLAMNLAYKLREKEKIAKIAVFDFDLDNPTLGEGMHEDSVHGLDKLVDKVNGSLLNRENLLENMVTLKKEIDLLRGSELSHRFPFVKKNHLEEVLNVAKEVYDYIVISTGDKPDNVGVPVSLHHADNLLLVGRYTQKNQWRIKDAVKTVGNYASPQKAGVVYNFFNGTNDINLGEHLGELDVLGSIPYTPGTEDTLHLVKGFSLKRSKNNEQTKETLEETYSFFFVEEDE